MTFAQRKRERKALMADLLEQDWDVFGTLRFVDGRTIGRNTADKLLRSYWNRVDRIFFGHAAERKGVRVPRWCFAHEGSDAENYHIHFLLKAPLEDTEHACCVLNAVWAQHHNQTGPSLGRKLGVIVDAEVTTFWVRGWTVEYPFGGNLAVLLTWVHGSFCDRVGVRPCVLSYVWSEGEFLPRKF
ncbi:hypothetical protein [Yoonia sp.]|jgi:hypothetical protein|uniref:hypothetical protein n=1 Tax=Yoonia sp. TaxID=2212373 RepID=UPI0040478DF5